jgi:hypothetical protein
MAKCQHHEYDIEFNIAVVLVLIVVMLMARELLCWFLKTGGR